MGILGKIKGNKEEEKNSKKEENVLEMVKDSPKQSAPIKENTGRAHQVLQRGHLSEKTNALANLNRYVFKVDKRTNKIEVKKAVENTYDVKVVSVNMVSVKGKSRRMGRTFGRTQDWKKAIVTLKAGDKIVGLGEGV